MKSKNKDKDIIDSTSEKTVTKTSKSKNITITKYKDLEGKFIHVKVGTPEHPASEPQIKDIQKNIINLFKQNNVNCLAIVTHHAVSMDIIEKEH